MKGLRNVGFVICLMLLYLGCSNKSSVDSPPVNSVFNWTKVQKLNPTFDESLDSLIQKIEKGRYGYIDEIFIAKGDRLLAKKKFQNDYDEIGGDKKGKMGCGHKVCEDSTKVHIYNYYHSKYHPYYLQDEIHTLQSITKSVLATMIGVAIHEGKLESIHESIYPYFKERELIGEMELHLKATTIQDLLTMQFGVAWKEFGMTLEMEESNVSAMELSHDWVQYVLNQPVEVEPGKQWNYNSGVSQMLSEIIQQATGMSLSAYADKTLFNYLDIHNFYWKNTPTGSTDAEGGLYLAIEDLAKVGLLYFQNGMWEGKKVLPENWAEESLVKHAIDIYGDGGTEGYGYQWWLTGHNPSLAVGLGYGNQILILNPEKQVMAVVYAWNIFDQEGEYILTDLLKTLEAAAEI